mmetsp:Transcript_102394/g.315964  ORF Transcript_102394/g.315964 Transcript_102394/m.315964 type:complete len:360 (-) Transcript_102394:24-1103(-)
MVQALPAGPAVGLLLPVVQSIHHPLQLPLDLAGLLLNEPLGPLSGLLCVLPEPLAGRLGVLLGALVLALRNAGLAPSPRGGHAGAAGLVGRLPRLPQQRPGLDLARLLDVVECRAHGLALGVVRALVLLQDGLGSVLGLLDIRGLGHRQRLRVQGLQRHAEVAPQLLALRVERGLRLGHDPLGHGGGEGLALQVLLELGVPHAELLDDSLGALGGVALSGQGRHCQLCEVLLVRRGVLLLRGHCNENRWLAECAPVGARVVVLKLLGLGDAVLGVLVRVLVLLRGEVFGVALHIARELAVHRSLVMLAGVLLHEPIPLEAAGTRLYKERGTHSVDEGHGHTGKLERTKMKAEDLEPTHL